MFKTTIAAFGLGCALLAGCAGSTTPDTRSAYEDAYVPTGSNIPRRDVKRADVPASTGTEQLMRAGPMTSTK